MNASILNMVEFIDVVFPRTAREIHISVSFHGQQTREQGLLVVPFPNALPPLDAFWNDNTSASVEKFVDNGVCAIAKTILPPILGGNAKEYVADSNVCSGEEELEEVVFERPKRTLPKGRIVALREPRICPPTMLRERTEPSEPVSLPRLMKEVWREHTILISILIPRARRLGTHEKILCTDRGS